MRFRTAIIWNVVSQFGQSGITFLSTIILARLLTPADFGIIGIVTIFIAFSQMMVDSEMGGALLRKKEVSRTDYSTLFYYNLAVSFLLYGILYFSSPLLADFYDRPQLTDVVRVISLTIIIHAFRVVQRIMIFRDLKFKIYAVINVISGIISLAVAIWMAHKGYGYWSLVWQQIVLALCHVVFLEIYNRFIPSLTFSKESFRYQFSFGISLFGSDTVRTLANNISTNIIAKITTLQFTGYYTQVSRITNFCQSTCTSLMDQSIFPMLAKFEDVTKIRATYHKMLRLLILALVGVSAIFIIFSNQIISITLGEKWLAATGIFQVLSLTICPASIQVLCRNILKTLGTTKKILYLETIKSVIVIALLLAASLLGLNAVIWSLVISQTAACIIWLVSTENLLKSHLNRPIQDK